MGYVDKKINEFVVITYYILSCGFLADPKLKELLNAQNKDDLTPLFLAINHGYVDVVEKITNCKELDGDKKDKKARTALYIAIEVDQVEALKKITEIMPRGLGNRRKRLRLLCHAAEKSDGLKVFRWLLTKVTEDDIQFMNEDKKNFMEKLSNPNEATLKNKKMSKAAPVVKRNLSEEASLIKDTFSFEKLLESQGENPMHSIANSQISRSCEKYDLLVKCLIEENPNTGMDLLNEENSTPNNEEKETLVVRFLNKQNEDKQTPLHIATEDPNIQMKNDNLTQGMCVVDYKKHNTFRFG